MALVTGALVCVLLAPYVMLATVAGRLRNLHGRVATLEERWDDTRRMYEANRDEGRPPPVVRNGPPAWKTDPEKWSRDEAGRRAVAESVARQEMDEHRHRLEDAARKAFLRKPGEDADPDTEVDEAEPLPQELPAGDEGHSAPPNLLRKSSSKYCRRAMSTPGESSLHR